MPTLDTTIHGIRLHMNTHIHKQKLKKEKNSFGLKTK